MLSKRCVILIKLGQANCLRKWLPVKNYTVRYGWDKVRDQGFCHWSKFSLNHRSYLDYRWETGYNDGAKAFWPWTKSLRSVVFISKQTALDSSAQHFECVPACQTEHFATTLQLFKKVEMFPPLWFWPSLKIEICLILNTFCHSYQRQKTRIRSSMSMCGLVGLSRPMW